MKINFEKYPLPKRMRHHTSSNNYFPLSDLKETPEHYPPLIDEIDWNMIFINGKSPDNLDVGCGKGKLLFDLSELHPNTNFLGIEVRKNPADWIESIIKGELLQNCGILWYSVVNGLKFIDDSSIENIYYLFPDPWPKKKHHKRRAFNHTVIKEFERVLKKNGKLYLATDVLEVHDYHIELLEESSLFQFNLIENDKEWDLPITNKETFCRKMDIPFYRIICIKK